MKNKTSNFWNIENEHLKNLIFFIAIILVSFIAILSSSIILGLINTVRFLITNPDAENLWDTAINLINTSNAWNFTNEVFRGILIILLIKAINRFFNKSKITLRELGFHIDIKQLLYLVAGTAFMITLFFVSLNLDISSLASLHSLETILLQDGLILLILIALANAFWQELIFRGYFQKRLINSYGTLTGIMICAFLFTIIHVLVREINVMEIVLGTVLFTLVGILYYLSESILFATAIHATGNFFLHSFATYELHIPAQEYRLLVYSIILIIVLVISKKISITKKNTVG